MGLTLVAAPPFSDGNPLSVNAADPTKKWRLNLSGLTTGQTQVTNVPASDTYLPIIPQQLTIAGMTGAGTVTFPANSFSAARTDAGQTFTGAQTISQPASGTNGLILTPAVANPSAALFEARATGGGANVQISTAGDAGFIKVGYSGMTTSRVEIGGGVSGTPAVINLYEGSTQKVQISANGSSYFNGGTLTAGGGFVIPANATGGGNLATFYASNGFSYANIDANGLFESTDFLSPGSHFSLAAGSWGQLGLYVRSDFPIVWTNGASFNNTPTLSLSQISAGVLGVGTGAAGSAVGTLVAGGIAIEGTTASFPMLCRSGVGPGAALKLADGSNYTSLILNAVYVADTAGVSMAANSPLTWSNANYSPGAPVDTELYRSSAGVVAAGTTSANALGSIRASQFLTTSDNAASATMFNPYGFVMSSTASLSFRSGGDGTLQDTWMTRDSSGVFKFGATYGLPDGVIQTGTLIVAANSAPADGTLTAGQCARWFDGTNGAAKTKFKAKTLDGTVVVGEVAMA